MITDERAIREKEFHNDWAETLALDDLMVREAFESPTAIDNQFILSQMGDLKGKKILDLGCGASETSVYFALRGADVFCCDIAEELLKVGQALARKYNVTLKSYAASCSQLPFQDNTFDIVYGNGVLHHVDLLPAAAEIQRVLKPAGRAFFIEPLPYNPLINVYRKMAQALRTEDETPLRYSQIRSLKKYFTTLETREFWFFSLLIFLHFYFIRRLDPSKVRYWKTVIQEGENYRNLFAPLKKLDDFALKYLPFLRPFSWNTVIMGKK